MLQLNTGNLYRVLKDFHILTGIRIVLFDTDMRELMAYPADREKFCSQLRSIPKEERLCRISDHEGCTECARSGKLTVYRCHAGLTEAVVPLEDRGSTIGYVMFGQMIPREDTEEVRKTLVKRYPEHLDKILQIPIRSREELNAAATVLQALTAYVLTNRWVTPEKSEFLLQLDRYIEDNLTRNISVEDLCAEFGIGRTRMYDIFLSYLDCAPAEYIRQRRMFHAQRLLRDTDMPISDISYAVGYADYNHFYRVFRKICGVSARRYRNDCRAREKE